MSSSSRRLLKELGRTSRSDSTLPEGVLRLSPVDQGNLFAWTALITSPLSESPYYGLNYQLDITVPPTYPLEPPKVVFNFEKTSSGAFKITNYIPHSNVNPINGEVCLNILNNDQWSPTWTLETVARAVVMLLDNQEPDSPLNIDVANIVRDNDMLALKSLANYHST